MKITFIYALDGVLFTLPLNGTLTSNPTAITLDEILYLAAWIEGNLRI